MNGESKDGRVLVIRYDPHAPTSQQYTVRIEEVREGPSIPFVSDVTRPDEVTAVRSQLTNRSSRNG